MAAIKQIEVQIMGQSYLLGCPEGGQGRLLEAVEKVDTAMCKIRDAGKVKARDRIAVLAALNLAFDVAEPAARATEFQASSFAGAAEAGNTRPPEADATPEPRVSALLQRLDAALGTDGHLL